MYCTVSIKGKSTPYAEWLSCIHMWAVLQSWAVAGQVEANLV